MIEVKNNIWVMPSHLDASTVPAIAKKYSKQVLSHNQCILDFSKYHKVDSAGLAMIIEFIKQAKNKSIDLQLCDLSDDTISLAKAHGVKDIITQYIK